MKKTQIKKKTSAQTTYYKFILRNFRAAVNTTTLRKIRVKGLYIHKITGLPLDEYESHLVPIGEKKYFSPKVFNYLTQVSLISFEQMRFFRDFVSLKSLRKFELNQGYEYPRKRNTYIPMKLLLRCLGRLPNHIESIRLLEIVELLTKKSHIQKLYQTLSTYRNLKSYTRDIDFTYAGKSFEIEHELINKYLSGLKNLKEVGYSNPTWNFSKGLQEVMLREKPCSSVTYLKLGLREQMVENHGAVDELFIDESSEESMTTGETDDYLDLHSVFSDSEESESNTSMPPINMNGINNPVREGEDAQSSATESDNEVVIIGEESNLASPPDTISEEDVRDIFYRRQERNEEIIESQIKPIFSFHLFPNLRSLNLEMFEEDFFYVGYFIVESFAALKKLKNLKLNFMARPNGMKYIFEGILKLPSLDAFYLEVPFLREKEWSLFAQFLRKQKRLISLDFITSGQDDLRTKYLEKTQHIVTVLKCLKNMPKLQYLNLKLELLPLDRFCHALEEIRNIKKLKSLTIDGPILPAESSSVEGICKFLKMQKDLSYFKLQLPFVLDENILIPIIKALSELQELRKLVFLVNHSSRYGKQHFIPFCEKMFNIEYPIRVPESKTSWHTDAVKMLKNLVKLEQLNISFRTLGTLSNKEQKGIENIFKMLPTLKKLRRLKFTVPFSKLSESLRSSIALNLNLLYNVKYVSMWSNWLFNDRFHGDFEVILDEVNRRQAQRTDLMF